ncbi:MAG: neutral/alkaline non-lysosomal ceramidase N-terminal domain-containing protein [Anaerolineae bacterium]|nr:neutral/alkaline non-lysosomal ceramidase N-terminal domain-containing protein [Anaerolineae bacterium]
MNENPLFSIGYAQQTITPTLERKVYLAGFGRNRVATSIHDDLYVRALSLHLGDTHLVLVALDLLGLYRPHCEEIEQRVHTQLPDTRVIIASTHTHHGPDTMGLWGRNAVTSGIDKEYMRTLKEKVVQTIFGACYTSQPADMRSTNVHVRGVAKNTRDPDIIDDELTCLQFCHAIEDHPLATMLIFPCHPEVLWEQNPHITSDYPGYLRAHIEKETGAPCIFFPGALGGMMTPDVKQHTFEIAAKFGRTLADAALGALAKTQSHPVTGLVHQSQSFTIPLTNTLFKMMLRLGVLPKLTVNKQEILTEANLISLGSVLLATGPGEILPKLGLSVKESLAQTGAPVVGVIGLANDELGYILPREDFIFPRNPLSPGDHYEETMSVGPEAGPRLMAAWKALIERLEMNGK